jgi:hypothetical protein
MFQSPFGALQLTTLPMGWTNIDNVPVKGPHSYYQNTDGTYKTIPENRGIRRFVWEHFQGLNRIVQRMKYAGGTFSGFKSALCTQEIMVLGHRSIPEGRLPDTSQIDKISNWGNLNDVSDI